MRRKFFEGDMAAFRVNKPGIEGRPNEGPLNIDATIERLFTGK